MEAVRPGDAIALTVNFNIEQRYTGTMEKSKAKISEVQAPYTRCATCQRVVLIAETVKVRDQWNEVKVHCPKCIEKM
jgi:Zn finger protein HypA/HybF involved in hydrogenase expression